MTQCYRLALMQVMRLKTNYKQSLSLYNKFVKRITPWRLHRIFSSCCKNEGVTYLCVVDTIQRFVHYVLIGEFSIIRGWLLPYHRWCILIFFMVTMSRYLMNATQFIWSLLGYRENGATFGYNDISCELVIQGLNHCGLDNQGFVDN